MNMSECDKCNYIFNCINYDEIFCSSNLCPLYNVEHKEVNLMSQQMVNGSHHEGSVTITNRMSNRYAVVGEPNHGKYALSEEQKKRRHERNIKNKDK